MIPTGRASGGDERSTMRASTSTTAGKYTPVAFRCRAIGGAMWTVDDVYVDPVYR